MPKIAIVTDSASDLPEEVLKKYSIKMLHFQIIYKQANYKDRLEITSKEVLENIDVEVPTTSLPSLDEIHEVFKGIKEEGYTHVIAITISSGLSGCYNAISLVKEDYPELTTYVYDSKTLSIAEAVLVEKAAQLAMEGVELPMIIDELDQVRAKQHTFFIVDTLKYLVAGGRIGHVSAVLGNILNLKPIITVGSDGKYVSHANARGRSKALNTIIKAAKSLINEKKCDVYLIHGDGEKARDDLYEALKNEGHLKKIERWGFISPVACVHTGPGFVGILLQETC
ncbi:MAG: DegV family protein [Cellulosilyticaceae bacterium]